MRRRKPAVLCIGETLTRFLAAVALFAAPLAGGAQSVLAAGTAVQPAVVAEIQTFRGRLTYSAHRTDRPGQSVNGTLDVVNDHWSLDERSSTSMLHVSNAGSWLR